MPEFAQPPSIEQVCRKSLSLPCAPSLLPRLASALRSDDSSSYEIERLISLDSSLAAATLRLANSAAFGRGGIDSLEGAILRLGAKEIYRLAALVLVSRWETGSSSLLRWEPGDFSRHALCVAIAAEVLAEATERLDPQTGYTAGLVCDLGKLALAHSCAEFYPAVRSDCAEKKCTWEESEKSVLGYCCTDVSERLLKAWKFPSTFVGAAQFMMRPNEAPAEVVPLLAHLHAAKYLATSLGPGVTEDGFLFSLPGNFLREWGFTQEMLEEAMPVVLSRAVDRLGEKLSTGPVVN
jgi:HD-like signal output (HDOD) protein